jgi:hypothetical protein
VSILIPKVGSREIKLLKVLIVSCAVYPGFVQSQDITRAEDLVRQLEVKPSPDQRIHQYDSVRIRFSQAHGRFDGTVDGAWSGTN